MSRNRADDLKNKPPSVGAEKTALNSSVSVSSQNTKNVSRNTKKRNWAFVVYPESAPENWIDILQSKGLQCAISPLHENDINPDNSPKKPHWHVIAVWEGPTSFLVVQKITNELNSPNPIPLEQIKGYYRYLTHKDNPEKYQYDEKEIKNINGFNIFDFMEIAKGEVLELKRVICRYIRENQVTTYSKMFDILDKEEKMAELEVFTNNTLFFKEYIKGIWQQKNHPENLDNQNLASIANQALKKQMNT